MDKFNIAARVIAILTGLVLIFFGLSYATTLFSQIYEGVVNPSSITSTVDQWARLLVRDLNGMEHNSALGKVEHLRIIALFVIAVGGFMLTWLTIHLVVAGAKVVQIAATIRSDPKEPSPAGRRSVVKGRTEPGYAPLPPRQTAAAGKTK